MATTGRVLREIGFWVVETGATIVATAAAGPVGTVLVTSGTKRRLADHRAYLDAIDAAGGDWRKVGYNQTTGQYYVVESSASASLAYLEGIVGPEVMSHVRPVGGWTPGATLRVPDLSLGLPERLRPTPAAPSMAPALIAGGLLLAGLTAAGLAGAVYLATTRRR